MRLRRLSLAISLFLSTACADAPTTPVPGALIGRFGGPGASLIGTPSHVQFETVCGSYRFPQALVPDANSAFALGPILVPLGGPQRGALALRGRIVGNRLEVESRVLTAGAETGLARFTLTEGQPADYANVACAA